jgi:hypothetical protein
VKPIVRYMILCEDWGPDAANPERVNIYGLLSFIHSLDDPPYPPLHRELCVFLALTETRGSGKAQIVCVYEDSGRPIFATPVRQVHFTADPLAVVALPFRIRDCRFPQAGMYSTQFWYNGDMIDERPLLLR